MGAPGARAAPGRPPPLSRSFLGLFRVQAARGVVELLQEPRPLLLAIGLDAAIGAGETVIAIEPVDDLECAVDRLELALLDAVDQFEDHALEPGDLQPGEFLRRGDPAPAQFVAQDLFGPLAADLFLGPDLVEAGARDERSENALGAGGRSGCRGRRRISVGHWSPAWFMRDERTGNRPPRSRDAGRQIPAMRERPMRSGAPLDLA